MRGWMNWSSGASEQQQKFTVEIGDSLPHSLPHPNQLPTSVLADDPGTARNTESPLECQGTGLHLT